MFDLMNRTISTRSGRTYNGGMRDFVEGERYLDHKHWLFPWKKERIYFVDIEDDQQDLSSEVIFGILALTILVAGLIGFILIESEALSLKLDNVHAASQVEIQCDLTELKRGSRGDEVTQLQHLLGNYYLDEIDGKFGSWTEKAVRDYQAAHDLPVTGIVDIETWVVLSDNCQLLS